MTGRQYVPSRRSVVDVRVEAPQPPREGGLATVIALATGAAGLVAYLYFLGGMVTWLRLAASQLAGDAGIVATDSKRLLSIGARVAVFELVMLLVVSAIVTVFVGFALLRRGELPTRSPRKIDDFAKGWSDLWTLGGMIAPAVALLSIVVGLSVEPGELRATLVVLGGAIGVLAGLAMVFGEPPKGKTLLAADPKLDWSPPWRRLLVHFGRLIRGEEKRRMERWWWWRWKRARKDREDPRETAERRRENGIRAVQALAAGLVAANVIVAAGVVPILQGTLLLTGTAVIYAGPFLTWPRSNRLWDFGRELVRSSGVWLAIVGVTLVALAVVATPPVEYPRATLRLVGQRGTVSGAYIDRNGDGVYVGLCTTVPSGRADGGHGPRSSGARIEFIAKDRIRQLQIGGSKYRFDSGGRPSLLQVSLAGLSGTGAAQEAAPLHHTLRSRSGAVCGE